MSFHPNHLCINCKRPFKKHLKVGKIDKHNSRSTPNSHPWCYTVKEAEKNEKLVDYFIPMDNLTIIETTANKKGIKDKNNGI